MQKNRMNSVIYCGLDAYILVNRPSLSDESLITTVRAHRPALTFRDEKVSPTPHLHLVYIDMIYIK